jgi:hypothetical protein
VFTVTPSTTEAYAGTFTLTFTVSDGINTSTNANSFSLNFITTITNSKYTTYLLKADASASDNQVDASSNSLTITESGNVTSTAFTPYHPKGYSTYFDGSNDSLQITTSGDLQALGRTGQECTIEAWVYMISAPASGSYGTGIYSQGTAGSTTAGTNIISLEVEEGLTVRALVNGSYNSLTNCPVTTATVNLGEWTHLALVLYNQTWTIYINGTSSATASGSYPQGTNHNTAYIGRIFYGGNRTSEAYIRDLRVTSTAEYTSNFTPTTESLTAVTGTELLTCQDAYLVDNSTNSFDITANGGVKTQPFSPYDHDTYTKSSHGGSVYFDGAADYLSSTTSSAMDFGTGDFTIEFWMYPDNYANGDVIADARAVWNDTGWNLEFKNNGIVFYSSGGDRLTSANLTTSAKQWTHVAFVRNSGALNSFVNGVKDTGVTYTSNINTTASTVRIGQRQDNGGGQFHGNLADFRIVSSAVYTSDFTPPTEPLTAITNTQLLTCTNKHEIWDAATGRKLQMINSPEASTTQYKWSNSIYFDDTDAIYSDLDEHGKVGTQDYTWEAWVYSTNITQEQALFAFGTYNPGLYIDTSSNIVHVDSGTGQQVNTAHGMSSNTWYHVAACRDGTNLRVFIDGTQVGSTGTGYNVDIPRDTLRIGAYETGASYRWIGYMEDVRLTIGLARYTSNFTVPSEAFKG